MKRWQLDRRAKTGSFYRLEDAPLLRGKGQFIDDIQIAAFSMSLFVRSQQAHARILNIDVDEARRMPGVRAVLTYEDLRPLLTRDRIGLALPSGYLRFDVDPFMLVKDEATYVGEPIALVVAQSRALAEDAAAAVAVEYESLPAVVDVRGRAGLRVAQGSTGLPRQSRRADRREIRRFGKRVRARQACFFREIPSFTRAAGILSKGAA